MDSSAEELPASLGYRMPAEWEPHEATWLSWPHKRESWPGNFDPVPELFAEIVRCLTESELVRINVTDAEMQTEVTQLLRQGGVGADRVRFHQNPTNDAWCRDHGPIYIVRETASGTRSRAILDWEYNAWGGKYLPADLDNDVPRRVAEEFGERLWTPGIVLEGGSIDVNGAGTLLTTEACLLNENRNPHLNREQIEAYLCNFLGVRKVLWLGDGIVGDDTDGHIDDLTRFIAPDTVVTVVEADPQDENYELLQENLKRLQGMTDQSGHPLKVVTLPMPNRVEYEEQRLPASYANFYIANRRVLVPVYNCPQDQIALETLQRHFPDRLVVGLDCTLLVWGLGAIHCITQQQPLI